MANRVSAAAMEGIYTLFHLGAMGNWTDSQLVAQFLTGHEGSEAAFRVLIHRHGPMVLGVCRRVLGDEHAAEDAFQTTFVILVEKAGALRDCNLLTSWLYGVALRVANKDRVKLLRRRAVERRAAEAPTLSEVGTDQAELRSVIDEEIQRLPERYRVPMVLCHLEGLQHDEVARRLGCPVGTIESRLSRARARLRDRLSSRGLAPTASVVATILRPPGESLVAPPLVDATVRAAVHSCARIAATGPVILSRWWWVKRMLGFVPAFRVGSQVSSVIAAIAVGFVLGLTVYQGGHQSGPLDARDPKKPSIDTTQAERMVDLSRKSQSPTQEQTASTRGRTPEKTPHELALARATRLPSARAIPLNGITIDGTLDDWPKNLDKYAINNQLQTHPNYDATAVDLSDNPNAYFMAGYDPKTEQIYLAVVVHDTDVVIHPSDILKTDAVEIFIDGTSSESAVQPQPLSADTSNEPNRVIGRAADVFHLSSSDNWRASLDAAIMPVLQYVGVPGEVAAYGDPWRANPSLVYARTEQTATTMKYKLTNNTITYEWSVKSFDRFPDRPARLYPGKRLGLEVAVVDKDPNPFTTSRLPTYLTWGSPPVSCFKGVDETSLGELIIAGQPHP
jgi:RNA polymerase sigma factor (sigma-70 family)